jgi:16S rRNA (guanine527-N7)-methyltransferase
LGKDQTNLLAEYKAHLVAWNKTHNLISKKQAQKIDDHISDSLIIAPLLKKTIVDLGSGGGLPGIPLAITNPNKEFYLIESNTKKSSFLLHTTSRLGLKNTSVINQRIEKTETKTFPESFDIVCRAVGSTEFVIGLTAPLLQKRGVELKLMKTQEQFDQERIPPGYVLKKIDKFPSKAKDKTRILVTIEAEQNNG